MTAAPERDGPLRGLTVLVIDDSHDDREIASYMLGVLGATVVTATDGLDALRRLDTVSPNLILCDLWMPLMDGYTFAKRLRANPQYRRIPLIAVTALRDERAQIRTLIEGFDAHLEKPLMPEMLEGLTQFLPGRRRAS
jgi:two-component system, cell cycle response regulator DivK